MPEHSRCDGAGAVGSPAAPWSDATRRSKLPDGAARVTRPCDASRVLHHVSLEVRPDDVERTVEFLTLLGFARVPAPESIAQYVTWLESEGTQVHLIHTPEPTTPVLGHPAVVTPEFDDTTAALRGAGFEVEDADELWGERRAFALMPSGQRVELMAGPPPAATS